MNDICYYCNQLINNDGKLYPDKKPLPGGESLFLGRNISLHHKCQKERWSNLVTGFSFLDQCLNDCKFFVRDGKSMYGWYEREGARFNKKLWAGITTECLETGKHLRCYPEPGDIVDISDFYQWLNNNGWWPNWWESRRTEIFS